MNNNNAVLYLRSSKDRSDVSPAAQRHALEQLAASRSLSIVATFEDAVVSGSSEDRPAFSELTRAVRDPHRGWSHILVYDTSRLARGRYFAVVFKHELKKRNIRLHYATRPAEIDPISEVVLDAMLEAMDEVLSIMSRQKGLAGMAENVRQGYRAGGRAPTGYRLVQIPTGTMREGRPVTKSRLEPGEHARAIGSYLRARARGVARVAAMRMSGLKLNPSSFIHIEWNALTYAGHTVWNVHRESGSGTRRRPREEWQIQRDTHEALITELEAERILARLESSDQAVAKREAMAARSSFLLSGILYCTDGRAWQGHGRHYRLRRGRSRVGRIVRADLVDQAVTHTLTEFCASERYITWLHELTRKSQAGSSGVTAGMLAEIRKLERERDRAAAASLTDGAGEVYGRLVEQRTRQIATLRQELEVAGREERVEDGLRGLSVEQIRALVESTDPARAVRTLVDRVMLDPDLACQIRLRDPAYNGLWRDMASPGGTGYHPQGLILTPEPGWHRLAG